MTQEVNEKISDKEEVKKPDAPKEEKKSSFSSSVAFREYATGEVRKVKAPWATIVISGVLVGLAYVGTEFLAVLLYQNPYAFNFILALYGIPAGFACAMRNKNLSVMTSLQYSTLSAIFSIVTFGLISFLFIALSSSGAIGIIVGFVQLLIALAIILVFSICVTFAFGAFLGTFIRGVREGRGK